jgi:SAM-dependent methyltransferase
VCPGCEDVAVEAPDIRKLWNANARAWTELSRAGFDVYRDLVNTPAFFAMLPAVSGLVGLDLGCGEGHNTRLLAASGADVVALDLSEYFIESAAGESQRGNRFVLGDGAHLPFRSSTFDFATAFMSLMDVGTPERALQEVGRVLKPEGFVQFSVAHPATSTPIRHWVDDEAGHRHALAVGDYFYEGPLTERWIFGAAPADVRDRHEPFTIAYARRTLAGGSTPSSGPGSLSRRSTSPTLTSRLPVPIPKSPTHGSLPTSSSSGRAQRRTDVTPDPPPTDATPSAPPSRRSGALNVAGSGVSR